MLALAVVVGGFLGACCRHALAATIQGRTRAWFPVGIFVVNLTGAYTLGLVTGLALRQAWPAWLTAGVGTGAIGAYTTYSTWANDAVNLWREGRWYGGVLNLVGSIAPGVALAAFGLAQGRGTL
jgi:CrcB protein